MSPGRYPTIRCSVKGCSWSGDTLRFITHLMVIHGVIRRGK